MPLPRVHDPGLRSLRTAARAAIVVPAAFAAGSFAFGDVQAGLFAAFGCFAPIVFANFGGPPLSRGLAYGVTATVGAGLIALGTALSGDLIAAPLAALILVFAIRIAGAFGGHIERAGSTLTLAFLIAVTTQAPTAEVGSRLAGWLTGGALATMASLVMWPWYERSLIVRRAADVCAALAAAVRDAARGPAAARAVEALGHAYATTPFRPAGPSERERAIARLMEELIRLPGYRLTPAHGADDERLASAMAVALDVAAARLAGGQTAPNLMALERERAAHVDAVAARAADALRRGVAAEQVLRRIDAAFQLRVASYVVLSIAANATIVTGGNVPTAEAFDVPPEAPEASGPGELVRIAVSQLRRQLTPSSARFQDAVRGATGIAIVTLLAIAAGVSHAFWIVLGTLAALRSSALGTGRTALETILGTGLGVILGGSIVMAIGTDRVAQWIALPITVFLAAYAPSALHFIAARAAFTLYVLVLLDLIEPIGWDVGLVRLEDVAIGAAVSLAVGMSLWPHGGREALRRSVAQAYRAAAGYLADGLAVVGSAAAPHAHALVAHGQARPPAADRAALLAAIRRASDGLQQQLGEPGGHLPPSTWGPLLAAPRHLRAAGDSLRRTVVRYPAVERAAWQTGFQAAADGVINRYQALAKTLANGRHGSVGPPSRTDTRRLPNGSATEPRSGADVAPEVRSTGAPDAAARVDRDTRPSALSAIEAWRAAPGDVRRRNETLRLVWTRNWLISLEALAEQVTGPVKIVAATASVPWWRQ